MKNFIFIIIALSIDAFQALIMLGLFAAGITATTALGFIPLIGPLLAGGTDAVGIMLGSGIDITTSATFGTGFIFLLLFNGVMKASDLLSFRSTPFIIAKLLPFIDALPFYTALTVLCILKRRAEERTRLLSEVRETRETAGGAVAAGNTEPQDRLEAQSMKEEGRKTQNNASPVQPRPLMQDIRERAPQRAPRPAPLPANDRYTRYERAAA